MILMKRCVAQYDINLDKDVQISFSMGNCFVETIPVSSEHIASTALLRVTIVCELKSYESLADEPIFTRAHYLGILGVISFLVDEPFDVFGPSKKTEVVDNSWSLSIDNNLVIEGVNCTDKLQEFLGKFVGAPTHEKELVFSLLDRWRKARLLEKYSEDSLLYNDEATLSYFHVLELLGDLSSKEIMKESKLLVEEFCRKYNQDILSSSGTALDSETVAKVKLLSSVLDKDISVFAKISFFLKKNNLFDERTSYWTKSLIAARNSVAHGRRVFYDKAIFPVQPFFPLTSSEMYPLKFLRVLTAKVISAHIGLSLYEDEWNEVHKKLNYGDQATKSFLNARNFRLPTQLSELERAIVFGGLNDLILSKKIKVASCVDFYQFYIDSSEERHDFIQANITALILLLEEADDTELIQKITQVFTNVKSDEEKYCLKLRDLIYYLDFHGFKTKKLESLVSSGDVR